MHFVINDINDSLNTNNDNNETEYHNIESNYNNSSKSNNETEVVENKYDICAMHILLLENIIDKDRKEMIYYNYLVHR